jgi:hypothetical protein
MVFIVGLLAIIAVGVFTGFTLSQAGLVVHWRRARPPRWQYRAALNGLGAVITAVTTVVFLVTKFTEARGWWCWRYRYSSQCSAGCIATTPGPGVPLASARSRPRRSQADLGGRAGGRSVTARLVRGWMRRQAPVPPDNSDSSLAG